MSITKKWLAFCLAVCMIMPLVAGCGEIATKKEDGKLYFRIMILQSRLVATVCR